MIRSSLRPRAAALDGALLALLAGPPGLGAGSGSTNVPAPPPRMGSKAPSSIRLFAPAERAFGGSHIGRPFSPLGQGRPLAPLGSGRPLAPLGSGRAFSAADLDAPSSAAGSGVPEAPAGGESPLAGGGFLVLEDVRSLGIAEAPDRLGEPIAGVAPLPPEERSSTLPPGGVAPRAALPGLETPDPAAPEPRPHPLSGLAEQLVTSARQQLQDGQVYLAESSLSSAVTLFPEDSRLRLEYALAQAGVGNVHGAARSLVDGFRLEPDLVVEPLNVVKAYGGRERYQERLEQVSLYQAAYPLDSNALFLRGFLTAHAGDAAQAVADFSRLRQNDPVYPFVGAFLKRLEAADVAPQAPEEAPAGAGP
ncbi:MAG: hypothetical protein HY812_20015 [Planctomycetes bacterium]|nr:hypothetical protein [Planctomycetota bacterium]